MSRSRRSNFTKEQIAQNQASAKNLLGNFIRNTGGGLVDFITLGATDLDKQGDTKFQEHVLEQKHQREQEHKPEQKHRPLQEQEHQPKREQELKHLLEQELLHRLVLEHKHLQLQEQ